MEFSLSAHIDSDAIIEEMYYEDTDDVIAFVKNLEARMDECTFTLELIRHFADSLRHEGFTVGLEILEP